MVRGRGWGPVLVALLLLLAGCSMPTVDVSPTTATPDSQAKAGGSPAPQVAAPSRNPWPTDELVVALDVPAGDDRDYAPLVRRALGYWEERSRRYAGYDIGYRFAPNATDPDVIVSFVPEVENCDNISEAAGCAPYVTPKTRIPDPAMVQIRTGLSNESTALVLKHELGHTIGLDHGDRPKRVMAANTALTTLPQPNATERALAWADEELSVFVDYGNASDDAAVRRQVRHALDYYDRGAGGTVPDNVSFTTTDDRANADVVVEFPGDSPCTAGSGSCGYRFGHDLDGDGALETYNRLRITATGIGPRAVGWHVAYWLGYGFGFDENGDWPAPLRDATEAERRGAWWEATERRSSAPAAPSDRRRA